MSSNQSSDDEDFNFPELEYYSIREWSKFVETGKTSDCNSDDIPFTKEEADFISYLNRYKGGLSTGRCKIKIGKKVYSNDKPIKSIITQLEFEDSLTSYINEYIYYNNFKVVFEIFKLFSLKFFDKKAFYDLLKEEMYKEMRYSKVNMLRDNFAFRAFQLICFTDEFFHEEHVILFILENNDLLPTLYENKWKIYLKKKARFFKRKKR